MKTALSLILLTIIAIPALGADWLDDWNKMQSI